ncbi:uncharacterized protein [Lepeophtheirus salmonis]|uniref:uncharacterized protein n=1 Tax=Lepeophtheirus salmonis TaxID=72036 RepID=UPI001AE3F574|nr:spermatogenesis associated 6-like protein [Lepeophtheirus salmonis]
MSKSLRLTLDMEIHAVSCPGVWFSHKGPIYLSVCFLGFHVRTKPFPPTFPLLFGDKFLFEKTFPGISSLQGLEETLKNQPLYLELLQEIHSHHESDIVLATFETSGFDLLFPYPQLRPSYNSGIDVDLLLVPSSEFPGIISPKVEVSTKCNINETRHPSLDQHHDNAVTINRIPPMNNHPHIPPRSSSRCHSRERDPFVVRRVDNDLIGRKPTRLPTPPRRKTFQRSKSMISGLNYSKDHEGPPPVYKPREEAHHYSSHTHENFQVEGEPLPHPFTPSPPPSNIRQSRSKTRHKVERRFRPISGESRHGTSLERPPQIPPPSSPHRRHCYFQPEEEDMYDRTESRAREDIPSPRYSHHEDQGFIAPREEIRPSTSHYHPRFHHHIPRHTHCHNHHSRHVVCNALHSTCSCMECCAPCPEDTTPHIHSNATPHQCCSTNYCYCSHFSC